MHQHVTASAWFDYICDQHTPCLNKHFDGHTNTSTCVKRCHPGRHQVWIDTPASLAVKYSALKNKGIRGVGMWTAGSVDYDAVDGQAAEMWDELKIFSQDGSPRRRGAK